MAEPSSDSQPSLDGAAPGLPEPPATPDRGFYAPLAAAGVGDLGFGATPPAHRLPNSSPQGSPFWNFAGGLDLSPYTRAPNSGSASLQQFPGLGGLGGPAGNLASPGMVQWNVRQGASDTSPQVTNTNTPGRPSAAGPVGTPGVAADLSSRFMPLIGGSAFSPGPLLNMPNRMNMMSPHMLFDPATSRPSEGKEVVLSLSDELAYEMTNNKMDQVKEHKKGTKLAPYPPGALLLLCCSLVLSSCKR